ncbi:MAG: hypothetical protein ACE5I9_02000 [Candidatus Methylomirabilales bacterium]
MESVGGARRPWRSSGSKVVWVLAALLVAPACARELAILAVPEQAITKRRSLQNFGEDEVEAILCFIAVGHANAHCKPPVVEPVVEPLKVVERKHGPILRALENPDLRRMDRFEQHPAVARLIEPVDARVVDAMELRPAGRYSRPAYRVGRCWFVFYATTAAGDPPVEKKEAIFRKLSVFCRNPQERGP